tara:strand:- start:538 stop:768 length:231 start_codon:yes stop_codon:yes gene_type:complete
MHCDNTNKDPFLALHAMADIDRVVKAFVEETAEEDLSEVALDFLHDLRQFVRSIYYKEPDEIEKAKSLVNKEDVDA